MDHKHIISGSFSIDDFFYEKENVIKEDSIEIDSFKFYQCVNCGAPLKNKVCKYCDTELINFFL